MNQPLNLEDYEQLARERLPVMVYDYYAGGAGDEQTLHENVKAWSHLRIRPRVLVDVGERDLSISVLGQTVAMPLLLAPCAFNTLAHPEGERAVTRAAAAVGIIQVVSTASTIRLEDVAAVGQGLRWFQLYCYRDRGITRQLVERAEATGYSALCVTVDMSIAGQRERDARNRFALPEGTRWANLEDVGLGRMPPLSEGSALAKYFADLLDPSITWELIGWLREITSLPIVVKGILTHEDASLAVEHGVDGIIVSNHGGRQLDGVPPTCEVLPEVVDAADRKVEVLVDGGIRRGHDIFKALALGARAVLIGRPYLWGLAVDGEAGVKRVLDLLREELSLTMGLAGRPTVASIDRSAVKALDDALRS
ncbi:MAG: alpha-hydroxy-acid oxidizing protein [Pseudomonadota bacterium]|nr:alpha-hydroxy-acid oxidizing protein [Pseudomonadota bacterium]